MAKFQKNKGLYLQLAIFVLMSVYVHADDTCEGEHEIEPIKAQSVGTGGRLDDMTDLRNNEKKEFKNKADLETLVKDVTVENALKNMKHRGSPVLKNLRELAKEEAEAAMKSESKRSSLTGEKDGNYFYYETCPFVKYWLKPGYYYFRFKEVVPTPKYQYCFNYWYINFVCCQTKQCMTGTCPFPIFDRNSECKAEERSSIVPFLCYTFKDDGFGKYIGSWGETLEFKRISLTGECCCRKRSSYVDDDKCPDEQPAQPVEEPPPP